MSDFQIIPIPVSGDRRNGKHSALIDALREHMGQAVKVPSAEYADMQRMAMAISNHVKIDGLRFRRKKLPDGSFAVWLEKKGAA